MKCKYGPNLDALGIGHTIGVMIDCENQLRLYVDDVDQGIAASDVTVPCRVVVDLYGQCEQVIMIYFLSLDITILLFNIFNFLYYLSSSRVKKIIGSVCWAEVVVQMAACHNDLSNFVRFKFNGILKNVKSLL